jgi:CheY-like chemotaxis protein
MNQSGVATVPVSEVFAKGLHPDLAPTARLVFVVDDEQLIADTLVSILREAGYAALAVYDAESALELAELTPPQLVLTDVLMPRMNGVELATRLYDSIPDCRILLLSSIPPDNEQLARARRAGYDLPLLTKPVPPSELLRELHVLCESSVHGLARNGFPNEHFA